jgi:hypothetical protein
LVPQALNPSLLASPQARRAPLSFLPDVLAFLLFLINPFLISMSFPWVIILIHLFLGADYHWDMSFQFFHGRIGD